MRRSGLNNSRTGQSKLCGVSAIKDRAARESKETTGVGNLCSLRSVRDWPGCSRGGALRAAIGGMICHRLNGGSARVAALRGELGLRALRADVWAGPRAGGDADGGVLPHARSPTLAVGLAAGSMRVVVVRRGAEPSGTGWFLVDVGGGAGGLPDLPSGAGVNRREGAGVCEGWPGHRSYTAYRAHVGPDGFRAAAE